MAVNKVEYGDTVLLDLTGDNVSADTLLKGARAHDASGEVVDGAVDLNNYYTKDEVDSKIPDVSSFATTGYVNQQIGAIDFSPYATKAEIPSIDGLATETFVNVSIEAAQPDLTQYAKKSEIPSTTGLATEKYVEDQIKAIPAPDLSNYATKGEIPSLNGYATTKYVDDEVAEVTAVASGKTASYVYDTVAALDADLAKADFVAKLKTGDVFLIRALNVPDYWWDDNTKSKQILETTKVDLSGYALTANVPSIKVNNAVAADTATTANNSLTVGGYTIVISSTAPTNANNKTITFVV